MLRLLHGTVAGHGLHRPPPPKCPPSRRGGGSRGAGWRLGDCHRRSPARSSRPPTCFPREEDSRFSNLCFQLRVLLCGWGVGTVFIPIPVHTTNSEFCTPTRDDRRQVAPMGYGAMRLDRAALGCPSRFGRRRWCAANTGDAPLYVRWRTRAPERHCTYAGLSPHCPVPLPIPAWVPPCLWLATRLLGKALHGAPPRHVPPWPRRPRHVRVACDVAQPRVRGLSPCS